MKLILNIGIPLFVTPDVQLTIGVAEVWRRLHLFHISASWCGAADFLAVDGGSFALSNENLLGSSQTTR